MRLCGHFLVGIVVRDEGVAGSNPATPTKNHLSIQQLVIRLDGRPALPGQLSGQKRLRSVVTECSL